MRQPKLSDLIIDVAGTKRFRKTASKNSKVKVTINIDAKSLGRLKSGSQQTGFSYERLLNHVLKEKLKEEKAIESRFEKLENELERIKRKVA